MTKRSIDKKFVKKLGKFQLGDLVSSYSCEYGNTDMPGVGKIIAIIKTEERPYYCKHNNKLYRFKESEIDIYNSY